MIFPFWYNGEIVFYKDNSINYLKLIQEKTNKNKGKQIDTDTFEWQVKKGIIKTNIPIKFKIQTDEITLKIQYYISMFESNIILILSVLFSTFFYVQHQKALIFIPLILGVALWFANIAKLIFFIKNQMKDLYVFDSNVNRQYLWKKQQEWIKHPQLCSACGEPINPYSQKCTRCGLKTNKHKAKQQVESSNITNNARVKINYTEK